MTYPLQDGCLVCLTSTVHEEKTVEEMLFRTFDKFFEGRGLKEQSYKLHCIYMASKGWRIYR